jgi:hypothetical protein
MQQLTQQSMLTTTDNPFNPFTQFDDWYAYDTNQGYNTCSYLARIVNTSDELSEVEEDSAIESAIDEIVKLNVLGIYMKVTMDYVPPKVGNYTEQDTES